MNQELYFTIGACCGSVFIALYVMMLLTTLANIWWQYVNDEMLEEPSFVFNLFDAFDVEECIPLGFLAFAFLAALAFGVTLLLWPLIMTLAVVYGLTRGVRFMFRIKKGLCKLITNKKCLKNYTEKDHPKMEL